MNRELRELFDENNIVTKKITIKKDVRIIDTGEERLVIKRREKDLNEIFKYLSSRAFDYFPKIIYKTDNYDIYEYVSDVELPMEERAMDIIKLITMLHSKTTFYREVDEDYYKEIYEETLNRIDYLNNYYDDIATIIEKEEFMSPSNYLFIRNVTKIFQALNYCKYNIDKWYDIISEKKRIRIVNVHNNLRLDHYLVGDRPCLISWRNSKKDMPIYDLINMYRVYYNQLDFCELLRNYEMRYPMLLEEKILFFCLISIPDKLDFDNQEYDMCVKVKAFYNYLTVSEKFISDYFPGEEGGNK